MTSTEFHEELVFFPSGDTNLAGILSVPAVPNGRTVLIPWGAGAFPSSARNRLRSRLARQLAGLGFHAFRFDYPGVGESEGEYRRGSVGNPYVTEVTDAFVWLQARGLSHVSIVANCLGAWSSLVAAPQLQMLEALALINTPVGRDHTEVRASQRPWRWWISGVRRLTLSKVLDVKKRNRYRRLVLAKASTIRGNAKTNDRFARSVEDLLHREIPLMLMYGPDGFRQDFDAALNGGLRHAFARSPRLLRLALTSERLEGFSTLAVQDFVIREVSSWLIDATDRLKASTQNLPADDV